MIDKHPIIGVMGSHEDTWNEYAQPLGALIAAHDYHLLTGGGGGVMTEVAKGFTDVEDRAGLCIGLLPTSNYKGGLVSREEFPNPYVELPIITPLDKRAVSDSMPYSRNLVNIMSSHAVIILPGSHGTENEASLALMYKKPMLLFGPDHAFERFPEGVTRTDSIEEVKEFLEYVSSQTRTDGDVKNECL